MVIPLAEQLRPQTIQEMVGQSHLIGDQGWIIEPLSLAIAHLKCPKY